MNFFFFLTVAMVSAFSIKTFEPKQLLKDPRSLVAAISSADPAVIEKLAQYAQDLIADGETTRTAAIDARNAANTAAATAEEELNTAAGVMEKALGKKEAAQGVLGEKTELESSTRVAMEDAWKVQVVDQGLFDEAQSTMDTELKRIATEDADLKNVKVLLEDLMPALIENTFGRNLLSEEKIDPSALQNVIDLVASLLKQGELDAAAFTKARDDAQDALTASIQDHNEKKGAHTHAVGAKQVATDKLGAATKAHNAATTGHGKAVANKERKDADAAAKESFRESEESRIDSERADFEKVIDLLDSLGDKEGGAEEAAEAAEEAPEEAEEEAPEAEE